MGKNWEETLSYSYELLWLISLVSFAVYIIIEWLESGFDSVIFASWIAILFSGVGFLHKK